MTLTVGSGPFAGRPQDHANFRVDGPRSQLMLEDYPQRLRAVIGGQVVLDSTRAAILHETGHQIVPYVPIEDFDAAVLERSETTMHCPFKGDASYWSLRLGDRVVEDAVWASEAPLEAASWLAGFAALSGTSPTSGSSRTRWRSARTYATPTTASTSSRALGR